MKIRETHLELVGELVGLGRQLVAVEARPRLGASTDRADGRARGHGGDAGRDRGADSSRPGSGGELGQLHCVCVFL